MLLAYVLRKQNITEIGIQRFLSGDTVIPDSINYKHFISSKNDGFINFCSWYGSTIHETTLSFTLFEVQTHIEDNSKEDYSI